MENLGNAIVQLPALAPGLILGAAVGVSYGIWHDRQAGKGPMEGGTFWSAGGIGMIVGAALWLVLFSS